MSRSLQAQLNVRSAFAEARAREIADATGMTVAEVVEEALRAYAPPTPIRATGTLVPRGPLLVKPTEGRRITLDEANRALEAVREREQ